MQLPHPRARKSGMIPNGPKVREALLHVIREADRRNIRITQFEILKTLFLADRAHLNRYGRPITFDEYVAMQDGPVPSLAYDVLKEALAAWKEAEITEPLWTVQPSKRLKNFYHCAMREASDKVLSDSDLEELSAALTLVRKLGYKGTWDATHSDPAYIDAWAKKREGMHQHQMEYALLYDDGRNENAARELKFISEHI
jgi:uncharacterized phage-associated protein